MNVKKNFCLIYLTTSFFSLFAQAPSGIPYQFIGWNASGQAIANKAVIVRFTISDCSGAIQETPNTNTLGLRWFSGVIGTISRINPGKNAKTPKVEAKIADYEANYGNPSGEKREILKQELTERFKSEQSTPSNN